MFRLADELIQYTQTHSEYIRDIIYGHYRFFVTECGADCLPSDLPADLEPHQIWKHCAPYLWVSRYADPYRGTPQYRSGITADPEWEPEHNLSMRFSKGAIVAVDDAPFEIVEGILKLKPEEAPVEEPPEVTAEEMIAAQKREIGKMADIIGAMASGTFKSAETQRWEKQFPAPPPGASVETDPSVIYGDWKLDPAETARILTKLEEETTVAQARKRWGKYSYRISRETLECFDDGDLIQETPYRECRRRGNRFDFVIHGESIWEHWFDGKVLVDQTGLAYRRVESK
jgi:hypothetical protein